MYVRPQGSAAELERRRRRAVEAVDYGERVKDVARIFGVARCSVYRWRKLANAPQGLAAKPHPGPATQLSVDQQRQLDALLQQGAAAHGWPNHLWTTHRVVLLIQRHFGIRLHHDHVGRFLRQRLGYSPQKPRRQARERDDEAIRHWRRYTFPAIARGARRRGAHLVFLAESGYMLTPTVRRTWAPRGQTPLLSCFDRRDRVSAISCVTVSAQARRFNFYFQLLADNRNAKAGNIVNFLQNLKAHLRGPFVVIWDGSRIHSRARLVKKYLAKHPEITVKTLPGYAPELNPDEGVWGWSKYGRLANLAAANTDELRQRVKHEFSHLKDNRQLLASFLEETQLSMAA